MKYQQFVEELRPLSAKSQGLFDLKQLHEDPQFRKWRHQVTDLFERIEAQGYSVNSLITTRNFDEFGSYTYSPSCRDRLNAYNRDLQDTINELQTIIECFEKFGDPKATKQEGNVQERLKWPEKMTLSWLWQHAHISFWWWVGGVLVATFMLGVMLGQSTLYAQLIKPWSPNNNTESATPSITHKESVGVGARPSRP